MILDTEITLIASSRIISMLKSIGIIANYNDTIIIPINKLWENSNYKLNVKCDVCGSEKKISYATYNKNTKKHNIYTCNNSCASIKNKMTNLERYNDENYNNRDKYRETSLERYGVVTPLLNDDVKKKSKSTKIFKYGDENYNNRDKYKETSLERYGTINPLLNNNIKEKSKKTSLERYGTEDPRTSEYVKDKRHKTNLERYGDVNYNNRNKYKETSLERYGFDSTNKVQFIKDKKIKSMLDKYGFISNSMTEESKLKLRNTNLIKYGVEYPMQVIEFLEKQQKNSKKIKYYNDKLYYQSSYEKDFLDYLSSINMLGLVERGPYIKYNHLGKSKRHYPDFYMSKFNLIIEIKSCYYYNKFLDKNLDKMNECIRIGYNYLFVINKNYRILDEILNIY